MTIVLCVQLVVAAGQWFGASHAVADVQQLPNPGERQLAILEEQRQTNARLDKLISLLENGAVTVKVTKPDEPAK